MLAEILNYAILIVTLSPIALVGYVAYRKVKRYRPRPQLVKLEHAETVYLRIEEQRRAKRNKENRRRRRKNKGRK